MVDRPGNARSYRKTAAWRRQRAELLKRSGAFCALCGDPGTDGQGKHLSQAHVIPHADGGADDLSNVVLLCRRCHALSEPARHRKDWGDR